MSRSLSGVSETDEDAIRDGIKKRENYALSPEFVMIVLTSVSVIS